MPESERVEIEIDTLHQEESEIKEIPIKLDKYTVLSLKKDACYMRCKEYELKITNEGLAFYHCKAECYPLGSGHYYAYIGKNKSEEFIHYIEENKIVSLSEKYPTHGKPVEGIPLTTLQLGFDNGDVKTIENYHHAPKEILVLQEMAETLISDLEWERSIE